MPLNVDLSKLPNRSDLAEAKRAEKVAFPLHYVSEEIVESKVYRQDLTYRDAPIVCDKAREPYTAHEVCNHAFAYDTGTCMLCGVSAVSARIAASGEMARGLPRDDNGIPYDPSAWARLAESFGQRETSIHKMLSDSVRGGMKSMEKSKCACDTVSLCKLHGSAAPSEQIAALARNLGSRERALDAWKAQHLTDRAKRNARNHDDHLDAVAMNRSIDELSAAQELQHAMSRPLAAEKSMRAQILLREDE